MSAPPPILSLLLEFTRTAQADEAFVLPERETTYVLRTEGGGAETVTIDWSPKMFADLDAIRRPGCDPAIVQRFGNQLRRILAPAGWARYEDEITRASSAGEPVRITIRSNAAELYALPWELLTLKSSGRHLGELAEVLLRYAWPESTTTPESPSNRPEGGRILFGWSAAAGAVPLKEQLAGIRKAAELGQLPFERERDVVDHLSMKRLSRALEAASKTSEPIAALHLLCHGCQVGETYGLAWDSDDESGERTLVDAAQLRRLLSPYAGQIRLVVLSACDSGNTGQFGNHLGSIAQNLHQAGLACVVASRFPLSVKGSISFTELFYERLLSDLSSVEEALAFARQKLFALGGGLDWASLTLFSRPEDGEDTRPFVFRPYRGLLAFQPSHQKFFFGRDAEVEETISDMSALIASGKPRFLVVAGASGTGKSSMVLAGVVPRLLNSGTSRTDDYEKEDLGRAIERLAQLFAKRGAVGSAKQALSVLQKEIGAFGQTTTGAWEVRVIRPGSAPMERLKSALESREKPERPFLLMVDQLEEIFTHVHDHTARQTFMAELWRLCSIESNIHCITSIRVDFVGECGQIVLDGQAGLRLDKIAYDEAHRVFVAQMGAAELRSAIEEPARRVGLRLEPGLVTRMIGEVGAEPSALPLIEYVLDLLWQRREGRTLVMRQYDELGGVFGALEQMADSVVDELPEASQKLVFWLLSRLTHFGEGNAANTRRRVPLARLVPQEPERRAQFDAVLTRFVDARLLLRQDEGGQIVVEIAHEALLRRWKRLIQHLNQDRAQVAEIEKLERWSKDFKAHGILLRGAQLGYAKQVAEQSPFGLDDDILAMIGASAAAEVEQQAAQRKKQRRERQLYGLGFVAAALITLTMIGLSIRASKAQDVALAAKQTADEEKNLARAEEQNAKAASEKAKQQLRIASAWVLHGRGQESAAASLLIRAPDATVADVSDKRLLELSQALLDKPIPKLTLYGHKDKLWQAKFAPDGKRIVTASADHTARIWDIEKRDAPIELHHNGPVFSASFDKDGKYVLTASADGRARVWDVSGKVPVVHWQINGAHSIVTATFSPDGQSIATGEDDGTIEIWNIAETTTPTLQTQLSRHTEEITALAYQADGKALASAGLDRQTCVWTFSPRTVTCGPDPFGAVSSVQLSTDGRLLLTGSRDGTARVWDVKSKREIATLSGHEAPISAATFHPTLGNVVATCSDDNTVRIWVFDDDPKKPAPTKPTPITAIAILYGHEADVTTLAFSPDGKQLVTGSWDETTRIWDLTRLPKPLFPRHDDQPLTFVLEGPNQDRALLAEPNGDTKLVFFDLENDNARTEVFVELGDTQLATAAFSPSGDRMVLGGQDGEFFLLELDGANHTYRSKPLIHNTTHEPVRAIAWNPESSRFITIFETQAPLEWNAEAPNAPPRAMDVSAEKCGDKNGSRAEMDYAASGGFSSAAWSGVPNTRRIALGRDDGCTWVFDLDAPGKVQVLNKHKNGVDYVTFSPDGKTVLTSSQDSTARVWRPDGSSASLKHPGPVISAVFDKTGTRILSKSRDNALRLWNIDSLEDPTFVISNFSATVPLAAFDVKGSGLITVSSRGLFQRWEAEPEAILKSLANETADCAPVLLRTRFLSEDEKTAKERCALCVKTQGLQSNICE